MLPLGGRFVNFLEIFDLKLKLASYRSSFFEYLSVSTSLAFFSEKIPGGAIFRNTGRLGFLWSSKLIGRAGDSKALFLACYIELSSSRVSISSAMIFYLC